MRPPVLAWAILTCPEAGDAVADAGASTKMTERRRSVPGTRGERPRPPSTAPRYVVPVGAERVVNQPTERLGLLEVCAAGVLWGTGVS